MKAEILDLELVKKVLIKVENERIKQFKKWGNQEDLDWGQWLAILSEEFGEVGQALMPMMGITTIKDSDADDAFEELIQLAAVAVRMAELIMIKRNIA